MKKLIIWSLASLLALMTLVQCKQKNEKYESVAKVVNANSHRVTVKEVLNASAYTYLFVTEAGGKKYWIAIPLTEVKVGKTYDFEGGMEMKKFESKDLKRTFESVLFVEGLTDPTAQAETKIASTPAPESTETKTELSKGITLAKGAISLHDLFLNKDQLAGKTVILTGKVVKYNADIMSKNWIHLQDGSSYKGSRDVAITTSINAKMDQIVTLKGTVTLNKDLGAGYKYSVLIEDAVAVK